MIEPMYLASLRVGSVNKAIDWCERGGHREAFFCPRQGLLANFRVNLNLMGFSRL